MATMEMPEIDSRFQLLMDSVKDYAIVMLDLEGKITSWNAGAEALLGFQEGEMIGQDFTRFFGREDIENGTARRNLQKARDEGRVQGERWFVRKDGVRFWGNGVITPLHDGVLRGYAVVLCDMTQQNLAQDTMQESEDRYRKLAEGLERMNQRKDEFLAMLSHELRNPLAPVLTALQIMRHDRTDNPIQMKARAIVERQVRQLAHLVDDLMEVSRFTAGKIKLCKERLELRVVLERAAETCRPLIDARRHRFSLALPDQPVWLHGDPTRLEQIVVNLLSNASKYTPERGNLSVILHREDEQAVVRVRDTGMGIAPDMLPRIFDLFTQSERALDRSEGGLGIGLALVKTLVEIHDGSVQARSAGVGQGSEFVVRLPIREIPETDQGANGTPRASNSASLHLLVVDDNMDAADSMAILMRMAHHEVHVAYTGPTAIDAALKQQPDVILLDLGLPGLNGYEVARQLRQNPVTQNAVIIAMTGYGQDSDKKRTSEAGFNHHLVKPVDPTQLQDFLAMLGDREQVP